MDKITYNLFERHMMACMGDSAHDKEHVYRVLYIALDIAGHEESALRIKESISTHRYRGDNHPATIEAKVLFDADKIDATGTMGIARTLMYQGIEGEPLYHTDGRRNILGGTTDSQPSFLHEYNYKLRHVYDRFYTRRGREIAGERRKAAISFYEDMLRELRSAYETGKRLLGAAVAEERDGCGEARATDG
jgi:uncharacterized protein